MKIFVLFAAVAASVFAQDAKLLIVEKPDSVRALKAYADYKAAIKRLDDEKAQVTAAWDKVKAAVAAPYVNEAGKIRVGWEKIQFSVDFRAIVPEETKYMGSGLIWNGGTYPCWSTGNIVNTSGTAATIPASTSGDLSVDLAESAHTLVPIPDTPIRKQ